MRRWVTWAAVSLLLVGCTTLENQSSSPQPTTAARVVTTAKALATIDSPTPTSSAEPREAGRAHTFQSGDTLWALANRYLGSGSRWTEIAELNGIQDETAIPNGTILLIPSGTTTAATTRASTTTRVITTTALTCSLDDETRDLVREWNRVSGELVASYVDISVGPNQYVADSERIMPTLNRVVRDMRDLRECLPADERAAFEPFLGTYNDKLSGYVALQNAVRFGSPEMEETAVEILMAANAKSMSMACEIVRITGERLPGVGVC